MANISSIIWNFKDEFWFNVTFIYRHSNKTEVYLLGDFNGWQKSAEYSMKWLKEGDGSSLTIPLSEGYYHYKFLVEGEYIKDNANPHVDNMYGNSIMFVHVDPNVYGLRQPVLPLQRLYIRPGWDGNELAYEHISIPHNIARFGVLKRPIFVYLPLSYNHAKDRHYPVVYAQDGQNMLSTSEGLPWGGWCLDEKLDDWWSKNILPEFILICIPNSDYICIGNRQKEYTARDFYHLEDEPYVQYLVQVIKPVIDEKYRTLPGPSDTIALGASLGGLMSFLLTVCLPNVFSCGICLSPAFWFVDHNNRSAFELLNDITSHCRVYIDSGDGEGDNKELVRDMAYVLKERNSSDDFLYYYDECKDSTPFGVTHSELAWRNRIIIGLKFAFKRK